MKTKKLILILSVLLIFSIFLSSCQKDDVDITDKKSNGVLNLEDDNSQEIDVDEVVLSLKELNELNSYEVREFLDKYVHILSKEDADKAIKIYLEKSENDLIDSNNYMYSDDFMEINDSINLIVTDNLDIFTNGYSIIGNNKDVIIKGMRDDDIRNNLQMVFSRGHGLISVEGTYYAIIDYVDIKNKYGHFLTDEFNLYLSLESDEITNPTLLGDYLAISIEELKARLLKYEDFLKNGQDEYFSREIRILYMTALWKSINPTVFDGLLNEDYTVNDKMMNFYNSVKNMDEYPVSSKAISSLLDFIESKEDGILGTDDNLDDLYDIAFDIHMVASEMIDSLYISKKN